MVKRHRSKKSRVRKTIQKVGKSLKKAGGKAARQLRRKAKATRRSIQKTIRARRQTRDINRKLRELKTKLAGLAPNILRDLGLLFAALNPAFNAKGGIEQVDGLAVLVGYGGPSRHPGSKAAIADIARFHDQGMGRVPQRKIIVPPDESTKAGMVADAERAFDRLTDESGLP